MSADYAKHDKPNTGRLFRNEKKNSDKSPAYTGRCVVGGIVYQVSGWINTARTNGTKYMSLVFRNFEEVMRERKGTPEHSPETDGDAF